MVVPSPTRFFTLGIYAKMPFCPIQEEACTQLWGRGRDNADDYEQWTQKSELDLWLFWENNIGHSKRKKVYSTELFFCMFFRRNLKSVCVFVCKCIYFKSWILSVESTSVGSVLTYTCRSYIINELKGDALCGGLTWFDRMTGKMKTRCDFWEIGPWS